MRLKLNKGDTILKHEEVEKISSLYEYLNFNIEGMFECPEHGMVKNVAHLDITSIDWICEIMTCCPQMVVRLRMILVFEGVHFQFATPANDGGETTKSN